MKVTPKRYAIGLFNSIADKDGNEIKNIVNNFVSLLIENNDLSKAGKISEIFSSLWNKKNKIIESEIVTAKKLDEKSLASLKNFLINQSKAEEIIIKEKIDKNILGGVIIKYDDKILDKSLKTKIRNLKKSIKN